MVNSKQTLVFSERKQTMVFSQEDKGLIKVLRQEQGYRERKFV